MTLDVVGATEAAELFTDYDRALLAREIEAVRSSLACAERAADPRWVERHVETAISTLQRLREYNEAYRLVRRLL